MPAIDAQTRSSAGRGEVVLLADPTAEGETIAKGLRAAGYVVIDVPLALLEARALGEAPRAIVLDVDQTGAIEAIERLRAMGAASQAELLCIGDLARAEDARPRRGPEAGASRAFSRPVDVKRLVATLGAKPEGGGGAGTAFPERRHATTPPPSYPRRTAPPPTPALHGPSGHSDAPPALDGLELGAVAPELEGLDGLSDRLPMQVSPELEAILARAEQRALADAEASVPPGDDGEDRILPPEALAMLDEPLDAGDDEGTTKAGPLGTPIGASVTNRGATPPPLPATAAGESAGHADAASQPPSAPVPTQPARQLRTAPGKSAGPMMPATRPGSSGAPASAGRTTPGERSAFSSQQPPHEGELAEDTSVARGAPSRTEAPRAVGDALPFAAALPFVRSDPPFERRPSALPRTAAHATAPGAAPDELARPGLGAGRVPDDFDAPLSLPAVLSEGDAVRAIATAIAGRASGSLAINATGGTRRIVLHDGDIVTAGSGLPDETLVAFLTGRGDIERDVAARLAGKLPPSGRHAGAALVASGHLKQDDLWPVLRAHAEWVIGRAIAIESGTCELEREPPGRLKAEPSVFGGATGAEVLVETIRRVVPPETAVERLGGPDARIALGPRIALLGECALSAPEEELVRAFEGRTVGDAASEPDIANLLYALVALGVLDAFSPAGQRASSRAPAPDPLDDEAFRQRVRARVALVHEGDYFALLGVPRTATSYEIRRAYVELRRAFEPSRALTARTADLAGDLELVIEVLEEAYEILRDPHRRERYRRAIEAGPP